MRPGKVTVGNVDLEVGIVQTGNDSEVVTVWAPIGRGRMAEVTVYGPRQAYGRLVPSEVNWSAMGSTTPENAQAYAAALNYAATIVAPALNREAGLS